MAELKTSYRLPEKHPNEILFLTVSGSHMYGFESPDSDYDLHGAHIAQTEGILSLPMCGRVRETIEVEEEKGPGSEEIVTHEIGKFIALMVKNDGNLVEQVLSPHVVVTGDVHERLKALAPRVLSRKHVGHYLGFAASQVALMRRRPDKETKIFLYIFRTLLSGITLATEGVVEANVLTLCDRRGADDISSLVRELVAWKRESGEETALRLEFSPTIMWSKVWALEAELKRGLERTTLPDQTPRDLIEELNEMLIDLRQEQWELAF